MSAEETTPREDKKGNILTTFTEEGQYKDEVKLIFDDNKELYVPQNFLSLSSPVFNAMFTTDFVEKKDMTVKLVGKDYDDFLEFLLCIHPAVLKSIDESNVVRMVPIAEEYQVLSISSKCKKVMKKIVKKELEIREKGKDNAIYYMFEFCEQVVTVRKCLIFLNTAITFNFEDIVDLIVNSLARFSSVIYSGFDYRNMNNVKKYRDCIDSGTVTVNEEHFNTKDLQSECLDLFAKLSSEVRLRVYSKRLHILDNHIFL